MNKNELAVVLVSGGLDSCVTAAIANRNYRLAFLHVNYGQRTEVRELKAYHNLCNAFQVEKKLVTTIPALAEIGGSSLTDHQISVPTGDLTNEEIPNTYVPFRNSHILSIAVSWAEVMGAVKIFIGAVHEDSSGYPDCRPEYFNAFNQVIKTGSAGGDKLTIETPLINLSKAEIVKKGNELAAPLHHTWSCYQNEDKACGTCDSCLLRLRGFEQAGVKDPISYV